MDKAQENDLIERINKMEEENENGSRKFIRRFLDIEKEVEGHKYRIEIHAEKLEADGRAFDKHDQRLSDLEASAFGSKWIAILALMISGLLICFK